jgi:hypothetical protein
MEVDLPLTTELLYEAFPALPRTAPREAMRRAVAAIQGGARPSRA